MLLIFNRSTRILLLFVFATILLNAILLRQYNKSKRITFKPLVESNNYFKNISNKINLVENDESHHYGHNFDKRLLSDNNHRCPNTRRPDIEEIRFISDVWQVHQYPEGFIYLYSAFYDDRPAAEYLTSLRLIVLATFDSKRSVDCHIWYGHIVKEPYIIKAILNETGMHRYQFGKHGYREYIFTCPLPSPLPIPTHVSVAMSGTCGNYSTYLPVKHSTTGLDKQLTFGVCVANGFGGTPTDEFVEWMELLLLYGVSEVNIYDTHFVNMTNVFNHYISREVLTVRKVPHPLPWLDNKRWYDKVRNLRSVSLNDCMLRNMYRYQYLIVIGESFRLII